MRRPVPAEMRDAPRNPAPGRTCWTRMATRASRRTFSVSWLGLRSSLLARTAQLSALLGVGGERCHGERDELTGPSLSRSRLAAFLAEFLAFVAALLCPFLLRLPRELRVVDRRSDSALCLILLCLLSVFHAGDRERSPASSPRVWTRWRAWSDAEHSVLGHSWPSSSCLRACLRLSAVRGPVLSPASSSESLPSVGEPHGLARSTPASTVCFCASLR